jgi:hypothetical protein
MTGWSGSTTGGSGGPGSVEPLIQATFTNLVDGEYVILTAPHDGTFSSNELLSDATVSAVVDVQKCDYSTWDTFSSITASAKPTLTSADKAQDTTLTSWTIDFARGDKFKVILEDAPASGTFIHFALFGEAT